MPSLIWLLLIEIASLTFSASAREIGVEKPSKEIIDGLLKAPSREDIYIWDGDAELILLIQVMDEVSRKPISGATVSAVRDRRVARHLGRSYKTLPTRVTDRLGRATLRGEFPAAGGAKGSSVFVLDSYVAVAAPGHVSARARVSPTFRLDFPRGRKQHELPLLIALKPR